MLDINKLNVSIEDSKIRFASNPNSCREYDHTIQNDNLLEKRILAAKNTKLFMRSNIHTDWNAILSSKRKLAK